MLSDERLKEYCRGKGVREEGLEYIFKTKLAPARLAEFSKNNVCSAIYSKKMGVTIQAESRGVEESYVIECEFDDDVLCMWDQPEPIVINITYKNGVVAKREYHPDFLVVSKNGIYVVETKGEDKVIEKLENNQEDWIHVDGEVIFKPARERFSEMGLEFKVFPGNYFNDYRRENLRLLLMASWSAGKASEGDKQKIKNTLMISPWISMFDLKRNAGLDDYVQIFNLINDKELYFLIDKELLSEPEHCYVALTYEGALDSRKQRESDARLMGVFDTDQDDYVCVPDEKEMQSILKKIEIIELGVRNRSVYRWLEKIKQGASKGMSKVQSLMSKRHLQGNRSQRLDDEVIVFINKFIKNNVGDSNRCTPGSAYHLFGSKFRRKFPENKVPSRATLNNYIKRKNRVDLELDRSGVRTANSIANPSEVKARVLSGLLPFVEASLDHCLLKFKCIVVEDSKNRYTAKPWLTLLVDNHTKMILGYWLSFRNPSRRSCGMVIRMCIKLLGRLPFCIATDRASEFKSVFMRGMMAHFGLTLRFRPASFSRFGSEIEREFGMFRSKYLPLIKGNTVMEKNNRAVSSKKSADSVTETTLYDLWSDFEIYVEWRNKTITGDRNESPISVYERKVKEYPFVGKVINYTPDINVITAVDCRKYSFDPARGIHIDERWYTSYELNNYNGTKKKLEVRFEPENPYLVYVRIDNKWVECHSTDYKTFNYTDPVYRWSQAVDKLDGRKYRDQAKLDASFDLVDKVFNKGVGDESNNKTVLPGLIDEVPNVEEESNKTLFEDIKGLDIEPLEVKKWG